jgi:hypothetical protein
MIFAVAAAAALATPSREALAARWLRANPAHAASSLHSRPRRSIAPPNLRVLLQRELAVAGRYQLGEPAAARSENQPWLLRALLWLRERWLQFWRALFARVRVGERAKVGLGDGLLLLVGVILLLVAARVLRDLHLGGTAARFASEPIDRPATADSLYRAACNAANLGGYGSAVLLLFAATIALLERCGAVEANRSATVGELRRDLRARNVALVACFDAVAAPFVQIAYADRPVGAPGWELARDAFLTLLQREGAPR